MPALEMPCRIVASVWIPPPIMEFKEVLKLVEKQYACVSTGYWHMLNSFRKNSWKVLKVATDQNGEALSRSRVMVAFFRNS